MNQKENHWLLDVVLACIAGYALGRMTPEVADTLIDGILQANAKPGPPPELPLSN